MCKCIDCNNLGSTGPSYDHPYPEIWCKKDKFDGIISTDELYIDLECDEFEQGHEQ